MKNGLINILFFLSRSFAKLGLRLQGVSYRLSDTLWANEYTEVILQDWHSEKSLKRKRKKVF